MTTRDVRTAAITNAKLLISMCNGTSRLARNIDQQMPAL